MSFEISSTISHAVDTVLLTFILVWMERQSERTRSVNLWSALPAEPLSLLPVED